MSRPVWFTRSINETLRDLETRAGVGLTTEEVARRQAQHGRNVLTPPPRTPAWRQFLDQFTNPLVIILLVSAAASAVAKRFADAATIVAVTVVNAIIGFVQERNAQSAIDALAKMVKTECLVRRGDERPVRIDAAELVPGDVVVLATGDRIPADLRMVEARNLQINESALTGESVPVVKHTDVVGAEAGIGDRRNLAFSGTLVTGGSGVGVVVETGDHTEIGRINALMNETEELKTPLIERLERFSKMFGAWVVAFGLLIFVVGMLRGNDATEVFMAAVAAAVGAIPEGLPAVMTIVLAIGVKNMAARHAIIRKLPAVETLGSVTTICSDKTGTLTANEMTVQTLVTSSGRFFAEGVGFNPSIGRVYSKSEAKPTADPDLVDLLRAGVLCNDAQLVQSPTGWSVEGDPTEGALLTVAAKAGLDLQNLRVTATRLDVVPFDSSRQTMITLNREGEQQAIWVKGAAEKILPLCTQTLVRGMPGPFAAEQIAAQVQQLAQEGMRVLAFARRLDTFTAAPEEPTGLCFLGLQAMIDPPRPEVREALKVCARAGVGVKMITGDHPATAVAIATDLGITVAGDKPVTGAELAKISPDDLPERAHSAHVFARVAPEHKYKLVEALQRRQEVVAMTGDGVNDAPALKRAEIGVAMGIAGTEVAKDASDMILVDDNFATLVRAVEEGRNVFNNLVKSMVYILPTNTAQGLVILIAVLLGYKLPITPVQVLWVNLLTAFLSLPLAFEAMEPGLMDRKPRRPEEPLIEPRLVLRIAAVAVLMTVVSFAVFWYERRILGSELPAARTAVVAAMVAVEFFYLFSARSLWAGLSSLSPALNPAFWPCVAATVALQLVFTYVPAMQKMMESHPIDIDSWLVLLAVSATVIPMVEMMKRWGRPS